MLRQVDIEHKNMAVLVELAERKDAEWPDITVHVLPAHAEQATITVPQPPRCTVHRLVSCALGANAPAMEDTAQLRALKPPGPAFRASDHTHEELTAEEYLLYPGEAQALSVSLCSGTLGCIGITAGTADQQDASRVVHALHLTATAHNQHRSIKQVSYYSCSQCRAGFQCARSCAGVHAATKAARSAS